MADELADRTISSADRTVEDARETLPQFRALLRLPGEANALVAVKTRLTVGASAALVWLMVIRQTRAGFVAAAFEVPPALGEVAVGDRFDVAAEDVLDWMYNMDGILYGGYSLRQQRAALTPDQQLAFDERIGVTEYA